MEKLNLKQFKNYVESDNIRLQVSLGEQRISISKDLTYVLSKDENEYKTKVQFNGYSLKYKNNDFNFASTDKLIEFFAKEGFFVDGLISISLINGEFETFAEFEKAKKFQNASMTEILQEVEKMGANYFCLVTPLQKAIHKDYPYGVQKIDEEMANEIFNESLKQTISLSTQTYIYLSNQGIVLPNCNKLLEKIYGEFLACFNNDNFLEEFTLIAQKADENLAEIYNHFLFLAKQKVCLDQTVKNKFELPFDLEFDLPENAILGDYLTDIDVTFYWHSNCDSLLHKVFKFEYNQATKNWLLQFENDYVIKGFDDLAFYNNDKIVFSSKKDDKVRKLIK